MAAIDFIQIENLTKSFGETVLFENISFSVQKDQKVALIAKNGTGKSTLLSIIAGNEGADSGLVTKRNNITIGFLSQNPPVDEELTVIEQVFASDNKSIQVIKRYEEALAQNQTDKLQKLMEEMDSLQLWDFELRIKQVLSELKINNFEQKVKELSGGQRKRIALANTLINEPDLLILDEPTNHLDVEMIEWLEEFMSKTRSTLLMVTHDRYFLDRVCNEIIEMDNNTIYSYKGNYSYFLRRREERIQVQTATVEKAKNLLKTEREWMNRQPQARGTKAKYRIENYYKLKETASQKADDKEVRMQLSGRRLGSKILELKHLNKSWGENRMLDDFSHTFSRNERIGIIGKNGAGKSTFLNLITQAIPADSGTVEVGETVVFGYYRQEGINLDGNKRAIEVIKEIADVITVGKGQQIGAAQFMENFLFTRDQHYTPVHKLSGGERRRLYLMTILMKNPNFLILDEPTNDLDIQTLNVLEEYLQDFPGCLLIVSHDRFFMDKVIDTIFVLEGEGKIKHFPGNYSDYLHDKRYFEKQKQLEEKEEKVVKEKPKAARERKLTYKEKQEFEALEKEMPELEQEKEELEIKMNGGELAPDEFQAASVRYSEIQELLDEKEMRWLELSEVES